MTNVIFSKWRSNKENREKVLVSNNGREKLHETYFLSVISAWNAEFVTYPLELIKTRLQIQGEAADVRDVKALQTMKKRGMLMTGIGVVKNEGFFKLWHGISSALIRHCVYSGMRVMVYKFFKTELNKYSPHGDHFPLWQSLICTTGACTVAQILSTPADIAKTQLQMEGRRALIGLKPRVNGFFHALHDTYAHSGVSGLWKGNVPSVQRAILVGIGDITAYDMGKQFLLQNTNLTEGPVLHLIGSAFAGFVAAGMGTPADVMKTRIMNQPLTPDGKGKYYKGTIDCFAKAIKEEGFMSLYKGFVPTWIRMTPWALTFWLSYEQYAKLIGAHQF